MGLYDDDNESTTTGDLVDVGYWQAKFEGERLEAALKVRFISVLEPIVKKGARSSNPFIRLVQFVCKSIERANH